MKKPIIKNYTTDIPAEKTINEIHQLLAENGASGVMTEYTNTGRVKDIFFKIKHGDRDLPFRLPAKPAEVYQALYKGKPGDYTGSAYYDARMEKSQNIAWRICKTWLEAQLTLVNLQQAKIQEVFLPYLVMPNNQTLYEDMEKKQFLLPTGE